jgi:hypothetical protein
MSQKTKKAKQPSNDNKPLILHRKTNWIESRREQTRVDREHLAVKMFDSFLREYTHETFPNWRVMLSAGDGIRIFYNKNETQKVGFEFALDLPLDSKVFVGDDSNRSEKSVVGYVECFMGWNGPNRLNVHVYGQKKEKVSVPGGMAPATIHLNPKQMR